MTNRFSYIISLICAHLLFIGHVEAATLSLVNAPGNPIGIGRNALVAANCYESGSSGADYDLVNASLVTLSSADLDIALNQIQPAQFSGLTWTQFENAILVRTSFSHHLEQLSNDFSDKPHVWIDGLGQWVHQRNKGNKFGYNDATCGLTIGGDISCNDFRLGAGVSYTGSNFSWGKAAGHASMSSYYGGLYGSWDNPSGYVNGSIIGAYNRYHTSRHIHFADIDRHAKGNHNGWEGIIGIEGGMNLYRGPVDVIRFARLDYIYLSQNGFQESNAGSLDLDVRKRTDNFFQSEWGIIVTRSYSINCFPESCTLIPRFKLSYINQVPFSGTHINSNFVGSTCDFRVFGWNFVRDLFGVSLGLVYFNWSETVGITVRYDGQLGKNYWNQFADISLDVKF